MLLMVGRATRKRPDDDDGFEQKARVQKAKIETKQSSEFVRVGIAAAETREQKL